MKYLVIEVQTFATGATATPAYAFDDEQTALGKYFQILSGAARSSVPVHSALMFTNDGLYLRSESFTHAQPEPEPDPEPEPEPDPEPEPEPEPEPDPDPDPEPEEDT